MSQEPRGSGWGNVAEDEVADPATPGKPNPTTALQGGRKSTLDTQLVVGKSFTPP